jgi:hypothetical protein
MNIIQEFIDSKGLDKYYELEKYIQENRLEEKFASVINNLDQLFEFALEYGILDILKYLYEDKEISYNINLITKTIKLNPGYDLDSTKVPIINDEGGNIGLRIEMTEKFAYDKQKCLEYLVEMKKKSKLIIINKNFYYKFHKKAI